MALGYFGFYEDASKVSTIITSQSAILTASKRNDDLKETSYRLTDGTLETSFIYNKYSETLTLKNVTETDRNTLKTEYDLHRTFYYYPDVTNRSTEYYAVKWVGKYNESWNKKLQLYTIVIVLKEV